jgi:hypothetical protein
VSRARLAGPTLHLNGSSADAIKEQLCEAASALRMALVAMAEAAPNARDYYVTVDNTGAQARREHEARCAIVKAVLVEYVEILDGVQDQIDQRDARRAR